MFEWWMEYGRLWLVLFFSGCSLFAGGYVTCFFMIRNNPKYLNVDKMIKEEIKKKREEIIKIVQEKVAEIK